MYSIALTTDACLRSGTEVYVAWAAATEGFSSRDHSEALALTPGGGRVGGVLTGAANDQLADAARTAGHGRLVNLSINEYEAMLVGLSCGGTAQCLVLPASTLPEELWPLLLDRASVALVSDIDGFGSITGNKVFTADTIHTAGEHTQELFKKGSSQTSISEDGSQVITVLHPVPSLVIVGGGVIVDALEQLADYLGWRTTRTTSTGTAVASIVGLAALDKIVVTSHDVEVAGPVLKAAIASKAAYVGALGSRATQEARKDWLASHGITDFDRIHGPAGLDIGSKTPQEIAVAIVAEALAVANNKEGGSLLR